MTVKKNLSSILPLLIGVACVVIIVAGMKAAASILNSFFLGLIIAIGIAPLLRWLNSKRIPQGAALLLVILGVLVAGLILIAFLGISLSQLLQTLPTYEFKMSELRNNIEAFLTAKGINSSQLLSTSFLNPSRLIQVVAAFLKTFIDALSSSLLVFFIIIFMVLESTGLTFKVERQMTINPSILTKLDEFNRSIRSYMFITAWTGALTAGIDLIGLTILGVDLAGLWALLFFLFNFIPAVGFLLAIIPPVLLTLLEFGVNQAILVFFGCLLMDNIMDKVIKPRYMQQGLDLSPLVIILSIIFWSWVLGATGAILAVPLTLMLKKLVLENYKDTQNLALLLGSGVNNE